MSWTKPELLIPQQAAFAYFAQNPGEQDPLKYFANRV
jgi:hypothetical protein